MSRKYSDIIKNTWVYQSKNWESYDYINPKTERVYNKSNQIVYVLGAPNVKDQVSSIKSLDLAAIQSSAFILRKSENPKIYKGKSAAERLPGAAKSSPRQVERSSFF